MQSEQLLTESQVFEDKILPTTESADHPTEDIPERHDHGKNFIGTVRIGIFAKSFILQVYDVLARHSLRRPAEYGVLLHLDANSIHEDEGVFGACIGMPAAFAHHFEMDGVASRGSEFLTIDSGSPNVVGGVGIDEFQERPRQC
jgi:hypothetical protein